MLTLADVSVSAAAQNQLAGSEHPPTHCSHASFEDSRMNVVALLFVVVFAYWLSTLIID